MLFTAVLQKHYSVSIQNIAFKFGVLKGTEKIQMKIFPPFKTGSKDVKISA